MDSVRGGLGDVIRQAIKLSTMILRFISMDFSFGLLKMVANILPKKE